MTQNTALNLWLVVVNMYAVRVCSSDISGVVHSDDDVDMHGIDLAICICVPPGDVEAISRAFLEHRARIEHEFSLGEEDFDPTPVDVEDLFVCESGHPTEV